MNTLLVLLKKGLETPGVNQIEIKKTEGGNVELFLDNKSAGLYFGKISDESLPQPEKNSSEAGSPELKQPHQVINANGDFWKDAVDFSKLLIVDDIEIKFANYCKERGFNHNETLFFRKLLADAIEFNFIMAMLKHFDKK